MLTLLLLHRDNYTFDICLGHVTSKQFRDNLTREHVQSKQRGGRQQQQGGYARMPFNSWDK